MRQAVACITLTLLIAAGGLAGAGPGAAASGIVFRGASSGSNGVGVSLSLPVPAGVVVGDVLVASIAVEHAPAVVVPGGWSLVRSDVNPFALHLLQAEYVHVVGGSEPASYVWGFSAAHGASGGIVAYGGVDLMNPVDASSGLATGGNVTQVVSPSVTASVPGEMLVNIAGVGVTRTLSVPAGMVERYSAGTGTAGEKTTIMVADQLLASAGVTGSRTVTANASSVGVGQLLALRPAAVSGDNQPPSVPTSLVQTGSTTSSISVSWGASSDNVAVAGYTVYLGGSQLATTAATSATVGGLVCGSSYAVTVDAFDAAGNHSSQSASLAATTAPCPTGTITEYAVPTSSLPSGITAGPDGNLWFTLEQSGFLGRITPSGAFTLFSLSSVGNQGGINPGPDGDVWFTENNTVSRIAKIDPSTGSITEYPVGNGVGVGGIAAGSDGNMWFLESAANKIGRITTNGTITLFNVPTPSSFPHGLNLGPDGNIWFNELNADKIGNITPSGVITEYAIPTPSAKPFVIALGPDGNMWFTESAAGKIGRITLTGSVTEFPLPNSSAMPAGITVGPDGNLWFTERATGKIGRITTAGAVTEFPLPVSTSQPDKIVQRPDGNLWFTEHSGDKIGRITP